MYQITLKIDGMACGMCESHVNEAIGAKFPVKKGTSSHSKGESVIQTEHEIGADALRGVIEPSGYKVTGYISAPYEKKGLFGHLKK